MLSDHLMRLVLGYPFVWACAAVLLSGCGAEDVDARAAAVTIRLPGDGDAPEGTVEFHPDPEDDAPGPDIYDVHVTSITEHTARLTFRTDLSATSVVHYDLATWDKSAKETARTKSHSLLLTSLMSGSSHRYRITVTDAKRRVTVDGDRTFSTDEYAHGRLPAGWTSRDVGAVSSKRPGSAWYDHGSFIVRGTGTNVYDDADSFHFVSRPVSGDFELTLKVESWSGYLHEWTKAMTMFRADFTAGSAMFNQSLNYSGLDYLYYRSRADVWHTDVADDQLNPGKGTPVWARLRRVGDVFTEYYSADGTTWRVHGPAAGTTVPLPAAGHVGFGVCSKNNSYLSEIVYSHVSLRAL